MHFAGLRRFFGYVCRSYGRGTLEVRKVSQKPALIFGPVPTEKMETVARQGLTLTIGSLEYAQRLSAQLTARGLSCQCHMKIDTGLNRSGIRYGVLNFLAGCVQARPAERNSCPFDKK